MRLLGLRILGVVLLGLGSVWVLQGVNLLPGSFMTGQLVWAGAGAVAIVIGAGVLWLASRSSAERD